MKKLTLLLLFASSSLHAYDYNATPQQNWNDYQNKQYKSPFQGGSYNGYMQSQPMQDFNNWYQPPPQPVRLRANCSVNQWGTMVCN